MHINTSNVDPQPKTMTTQIELSELKPHVLTQLKRISHHIRIIQQIQQHNEPSNKNSKNNKNHTKSSKQSNQKHHPCNEQTI